MQGRERAAKVSHSHGLTGAAWDSSTGAVFNAEQYGERVVQRGGCGVHCWPVGGFSALQRALHVHQTSVQHVSWRLGVAYWGGCPICHCGVSSLLHLWEECHPIVADDIILYSIERVYI